MTAPATSYISDADTIEAAVYQALGAASMCWDTLRGAGVFHSEEAKAIADELIARIHAERNTGPVNMYTRPGDVDPDEIAERIVRENKRAWE